MTMPVTVLVTYRPKKGCERKFFNLLERHWPTLRKERLVTATRPTVWKATDKKTSRTFYVEMFEWKSIDASDLAHETPEVMAVWGPMMPLLESMDIAAVEQVELRVR